MSFQNGLQQVSVEKLRLDPHNPRLPDRLKNASEKPILNWMLTDATLTDLMASIVENSFFAGEALIGIVEPAEPDAVIIVEGNRRLASVKLLKDPSLADEKPKTVQNLATEIAGNGKLPNTLPVYIVESRDDVANYLGFRHISGVKQWPVIAKARYLHSLFATRKWSPDIYRQLAKEIGSKSVYVRRLIIGYRLYKEIEERNFFDLDYLNEETFDLSLITDTATKYSDLAAYIQVDIDHEDPLKNLNLAALGEVFKWLYERNESGETRLGESRNLPVLNKVLATDEARRAFTEDNYTLYDAAALTSLADDNIRGYLLNARNSMIEAQKMLHNLKAPNKSDIRLVEEINNSAEIIKNEMTRALFEKSN